MKKLIVFLMTAIFVTACSAGSSSTVKTEDNMQSKNLKQKLFIDVGDITLTADLVENSSTIALVELLSKGPIKIDMHDFGEFEKSGDLEQTLPRNDEHFSTGPGDIILYQGRTFVIYYDYNTYTFTRIGKIQNATPQIMRKLFAKESIGDGNISITIRI